MRLGEYHRGRGKPEGREISRKKGWGPPRSRCARERIPTDRPLEAVRVEIMTERRLKALQVSLTLTNRRIPLDTRMLLPLTLIR